MTLQEALRYSTDNRTHSDFVDAALAQPESEVHPLVYADWLQEQGQEGLAEQVRKAVADNGSKQKTPSTTQAIAQGLHRSRGLPSPDFTKPSVVIDNFPARWYVGLTTFHPDSQGKVAFFDSQHSAEDALKVLQGMGEVAGVEEALGALKKKHLDLFTEPKPEE